MDEWLASTSGMVVEGWSVPWTAAAIQASTAAALSRNAALAERPADACLILVDLVDHLAHLAAEPLAQLAAEGRATGRKLVVRVHGAWRHQARDFGEPEGPDLRAVWEAADAVFVASRNHLVRLASGGGIDAGRTRLAPVGIAGPEAGTVGAPELGDRTRLLVAGETHREALAPVLEMLREADPKKATYQVISSASVFRRELTTARAVLVPATEAFGDRALVDAALRAGVAVVASEGASAIDAPLPPGLTVVSDHGSSAAWREALEVGLGSREVPVARDLEEILERQLEILGAISSPGEAAATHFEREAAA